MGSKQELGKPAERDTSHVRNMLCEYAYHKITSLAPKEYLKFAPCPTKENKFISTKAATSKSLLFPKGVYIVVNYYAINTNLQFCPLDWNIY